MKDKTNGKFIRIISPVTLAVVIALDIGVIAYAVHAVKTLAMRVNTMNIIFAVFVIFAFAVAFLTTRETVKHGVIFRDDEMEFTGMDNDNIFKFEDIVSVAYVKDEKPSFVKNFIDRQSRIVLTYPENKVVTVDIGITTKNKLKEIEKEIEQRLKKSDKIENKSEDNYSDDIQGED